MEFGPKVHQVQASRSRAVVAARDRLIQALSGRLSRLGPREVADRVEAIAAIFQGLIVRAVHNPDLDRAAFVRTAHLVLRELLTNDTTAALNQGNSPARA
jgi:hypothetical protein